MKDNELKIFLNTNHNGNLIYEGGKYIFNYLTNAKDIVSLTMPFRAQSWTNKTLHPIFQMNLPEGALKDAIKNHFSKIETMNDFNLLKLIGPYMLGRVKFESPTTTKEALLLNDILSSSKENLFNELMQRFAIHSGVSGVQPKILLSAHNKTSMKLEHFIVKSWEREYPNLALNEYFCMRAVKNANLPTPQFYLSDDFSIFVIERFDVKNDKDYFGFEDMCVLSGRDTEQKYEGSYEQIARVIKDILPTPRKKEGVKTFFKAIIMNHLLRNGDGHLKNYGILYEKDFSDSFLAPIYDVITSTIYIKNDTPALKLGDNKLWWRERTYKTFAKQSCDISNGEYKDILTQCIDAIKKTKQEMISFDAKNSENREFLDNLANHWRENLN